MLGQLGAELAVLPAQPAQFFRLVFRCLLGNLADEGLARFVAGSEGIEPSGLAVGYPVIRPINPGPQRRLAGREVLAPRIVIIDDLVNALFFFSEPTLAKRRPTDADNPAAALLDVVRDPAFVERHGERP